MIMTWREFKARVDELLKKKNIDQDTAIWYIDVSFPDKRDFEEETIMVTKDGACGIAIG